MTMKTGRFLLAGAIAAFLTAACGTPGTDGLRDAFARQLMSNNFVTDAARNGDDITFSGPGAEGGVAMWRVHIDTAIVEPQDDPAMPYKGTVTSSWYSDGQIVQPRGEQSNLPVELAGNGLAQDCWALWNSATEQWEWE